MTDKQPEALRLAEELDGNVYEIPADRRGWSDNEQGDHLPNNCIRDAAAELRRLHDENEVLRRCLFQMQEAAKGQPLTAAKATGEQQ